jgi:hypothetical protein
MKVSYTTYNTIEIPEREAKRVACEVMLGLFGFSDDHYIAANGELCTLSYPHPHCGSQSVEVIRRATAQDKIHIQILEQLKKESRQ